MSKNLILRNKIWHLRFMMKGVMIAESTHTANLREAEMILARRKSELIQDVILDDKRISKFHAAIDAFVNSRHTESSKKYATYSMSKFRVIADNDLKKIERHSVLKVVADLKTTNKLSTVGIHIRYWNSFANWCLKEKYHICGKIENIKNVEGKTRWLTKSEQEALLKALDPTVPYTSPTDHKTNCKQDNYDFTILCLDTGVRYSEGASLEWSHVDLHRGVIYVKRQKHGNPTTLSMTNRLKEILLRRSEGSGHYVFPMKVGKNHSRGWMTAAVTRAKLNTAHGNVTVHTLRHTYAATMIQNGVQLNQVQHLLGHKNIAMTNRYAHFIKQDVAVKAAEILNAINDPKSVPTQAPTSV